MNWEERLKRWADSAEGAVGKAVDFGSAEIPEYVRELIRWEIISNLITLGFYLTALLLLQWAVRRSVRFAVRRLNETQNDDGPIFGGFIFGGGGAFVAAVVMVVNIYASSHAAAKAYFAPRVVVVEKLAALAKTGSVSAVSK